MEILIFVAIGGVIGLIIRTAMNAGKSNAPKEYMYSCSQTALIDAIKKASQQLGYEVNRVDEVGGAHEAGCWCFNGFIWGVGRYSANGDCPKQNKSRVVVCR